MVGNGSLLNLLHIPNRVEGKYVCQKANAVLGKIYWLQKNEIYKIDWYKNICCTLCMHAKLHYWHSLFVPNFIIRTISITITNYHSSHFLSLYLFSLRASSIVPFLHASDVLTCSHVYITIQLRTSQWHQHSRTTMQCPNRESEHMQLYNTIYIA